MSDAFGGRLMLEGDAVGTSAAGHAEVYIGEQRASAGDGETKRPGESATAQPNSSQRRMTLRIGVERMTYDCCTTFDEEKLRRSWAENVGE